MSDCHSLSVFFSLTLYLSFLSYFYIPMLSIFASYNFFAHFPFKFLSLLLISYFLCLLLCHIHILLHFTVSLLSCRLFLFPPPVSSLPLSCLFHFYFFSSVSLLSCSQNYFKDAWNIFDCVTVLGSITDILVTELGVSSRI